MVPGPLLMSAQKCAMNTVRSLDFLFIYFKVKNWTTGLLALLPDQFFIADDDDNISNQGKWQHIVLTIVSYCIVGTMSHSTWRDPGMVSEVREKGM